MAKGMYSKKRTITDKLVLKGVMSDDGEFITYTDNDDNEEEIDILEALGVFKGKAVDISVTMKSEGEMPEAE